MDLAGNWSRKLAMKKTGLPAEKIGCVFISPCPAKATSVKRPLATAKSPIDAVVSIADVYPRLLTAIKKIDKPEHLVQAGAIGVGWARSGGEGVGTNEPNHLSASGLENIIRILEAMEDDKLANVNFIELNACGAGCVGGVLAVEIQYIARARLDILKRKIGPVLPTGECPVDDMRWDGKLEYDPVLQLAPNLEEAMFKMDKIQDMVERLEGMDCGACGAPTCKALAEDIVKGLASEEQCIFVVREKLQKLLDEKENKTS